MRRRMPSAFLIGTLLVTAPLLALVGNRLVAHAGPTTSRPAAHRVLACGVERWAVKTGIDRDAHLVNLNKVVPTTISHLRSLPAPANPPLTSRVKPAEITVFQVSAILLRIKEENDSDYHLVISDTGGRTMIAEIPAPQCVGKSSPFLPKITYTRRVVEQRFHPQTFWIRMRVPVQVTGVGFFDFQHGQSGVAPNAIELHPVLNVRFASGNTLPPATQPTAVPTAPSGKVSVSARVSDSTPARYTRVTVYGKLTAGGHGVSGVTMTAAWHFKTGTGTCTGVSGSSGSAQCSRYIGRATSGYTVKVGISFAYKGQTYSTSTSFTPQ